MTFKRTSKRYGLASKRLNQWACILLWTNCGQSGLPMHGGTMLPTPGTLPGRKAMLERVNHPARRDRRFERASGGFGPAAGQERRHLGQAARHDTGLSQNGHVACVAFVCHARSRTMPPYDSCLLYTSDAADE